MANGPAATPRRAEATCGYAVVMTTCLGALACGSYDFERVRGEADAYARSYLSSVDSAPSRAADFLDREFFPTDPPWILLGAVNAELGKLRSLKPETVKVTTGLNRSGEMFVELAYQAEHAEGSSAVNVILRRSSGDAAWSVRGHVVSYESLTIALAEEADRFLEGYFASLADREFDTALNLYSESFFRGVPADEWHASLAATRDTLGRPGNRSLIEADVGGNVLTGAAVISLEYTVAYENRLVIERFVVVRASRDQPKEIHSHEISTDQVETKSAKQ